MSKRISLLEDALHVCSGTGGDHPLLASELLRIKQEVDIWDGRDEDGDVHKTDWNDVGTLVMSGGGVMRYVGSSATEVRCSSRRVEETYSQPARTAYSADSEPLPQLPVMNSNDGAETIRVEANTISTTLL